MDAIDKYRLPEAPCEILWSPEKPRLLLVTKESNEFFWYYHHQPPLDCVIYLRSLIDDIGSRRIV